MMRLMTALVVGLVLYVPAGASAQTITSGRSLKERCATFQLTSPSAGLACRGYIGAVADVLSEGNAIDGHRACPPATVRREELVRQVIAWLDRHPDLLDAKAYRLTAEALSERYPCPSQ